MKKNGMCILSYLPTFFALGPTESFQADEGDGTSTTAGEP